MPDIKTQKIKTFHEKTLEDLGDYEDGSNLSSPQNSENFTIQVWTVRIPAKRFLILIF